MSSGKGSVLHLYYMSRPGQLTAQGGPSQPELIDTARSLLQYMSQKVYPSCTYPSKDKDCYGEWESEFGEKGGELRGHGFILQIPRHKEWKNNHHFVRVTSQNPSEYVQMLKGSGFCPPPDTPVFPLLDVEIKSKKPETSTFAMSLVLRTSAINEIDTEFVVLQQDTAGSLQWKNITSHCQKDHSDVGHNVVIKIPIEKSSKIWVVKVRRSFRSLMHVLLSLLFGKIVFRILVFSKIRDDKQVLIRVLGMCEELYQNPLGRRNDVHIAKEQGFKTVEESDAKELLKKGQLLLSFYLSGKCQKSTYFDLSGDSIFKVAQRHDFEYIVGESGCIPKIEVQTDKEDEDVVWSFNLNNYIQEQIEAPIPLQLGTSSPDGNKISDPILLQVAAKVAAKWKVLGVCLGISSDTIDIIDRDYPFSVVDKCFTLLKRWRSVKSGTIMELHLALCDQLMQRNDVAADLLATVRV